MSADIFDGPYFDPKEREVFGYVDCPPIGKIRVNIETTAISVDLEFSEPDSMGNSTATAHANLDPDAVQATLTVMQPLWECWGQLWPKIYESLIEVRKDYEKEAPISSDNSMLSICPPGDYIDYDTECWSCSLEMEPFDGCFDVEFELDGAILEAAASF